MSDLDKQFRQVAKDNFERLASYKRIGEEMGIPGIIRDIWAEQQWKALGFDTWEAACTAYLGTGWRPWDRIEQRREMVAELTEQGMSTRAIGTALGVDQKTVVNDRRSGEEHSSPAPVPVTGLDGKTYPSPITPEQKQAADDLLNESEQQLQDYLNTDDEYLNLQKRHKFAQWVSHLAGYHIFDFNEMRELEPPTDNQRRMFEKVIGQLQTYLRPQFNIIQGEGTND